MCALAPYQMEVLPGFGYDSLQSIPKGQVLNYNYSQCQISKDGKYLLPDNVYLIPLRKSHFVTSAEYFDHWDNYTTAISFSLSFGAGVQGVASGKLSFEYQNVKSRMYNQDSKLTRTHAKSTLYTVKIEPDAALHPALKESLFDIAACIQRNDMRQARYLAELVVRDFGTHCIVSLDAGATIVQTSYIRSSYVQQSTNNLFSITQSASAVFDDVLNISAQSHFAFDNSYVHAFLSNRTHSEFTTYGGPTFQTKYSFDDWVAGLDNSLVTIDQSGVPLHSIITPNTLPELHAVSAQMISDLVHEAITRYHRLNTRPGCTNPRAKNFDFHANVDNGICDYPRNNYTFGGVYQTCTLDSKENYEDICTVGPQASQHNPLTGDFSCPAGYMSIKINSGTITHVTKHVPHVECHRLWWTLDIVKKCTTVFNPVYSKAYYETYWCAAMEDVPDHSGYLFGGLYTSSMINPITNTKGCPAFFILLHMGEDIRVCVSDDYERAYAKSIPFAGFQSCHSGNPLAAKQGSDSKNWPSECPLGYAQHLVEVEDGCEINYCVQFGAFTPQSFLPAHLPPFHKKPKYVLNDTEPMILSGRDRFWIKDSDGHWIPSPFDPDRDRWSPLIPNDEKTTEQIPLSTSTACEHHDSTSVSLAQKTQSMYVVLFAIAVTVAVVSIVVNVALIICVIKRKSDPSRKADSIASSEQLPLMDQQSCNTSHT